MNDLLRVEVHGAWERACELVPGMASSTPRSNRLGDLHPFVPFLDSPFDDLDDLDDLAAALPFPLYLIGRDIPQSR